MAWGLGMSLCREFCQLCLVSGEVFDGIGFGWEGARIERKVGRARLKAD